MAVHDMIMGGLQVTRGRVVLFSNNSRFEFLIGVVIGVVIVPARPSLVSRARAWPFWWHSDGVVAVRAGDGHSVGNSRG